MYPQDFYYAHITHDELTEDTDAKTQKFLVYLTQAFSDILAENHFKALETQFQGKNFKILTWGLLKIPNDAPMFMGIATQPKPPTRASA